MSAPLQILVTGATGFIGGHLARTLAALGHRVRALVRREAPDLAEHGIALIPGDMVDTPTLRAAMQGVEVVFHMAAVRDAWGLPEAVYRHVNVEGTRNLLDAAAEAGVQRFVYCSSVGVARFPGNLAADETLPYCEPVSQMFYHRTKAEAEQIARSAGAIVVRPVITYGPGDEYGFVTQLISLLARGRFIGIGNGRNHVDLAYIDDLVSGIWGAYERGAAGQVYILSGTAPIEVRALVGEICNLLERMPPWLHIPTPVAHLAGWTMELFWRGAGWAGGQRAAPFITRDKVATLTVDRGFSHRRASLELGYQPQVGYAEGLQRTWEWFVERTESPT